MANQGLFVRGAIDVGELYMDDLIIFGQALVDAYKAESNGARDPRIILTRSARKMIEEHDKSWLKICEDNGDCMDVPQSLYMNSICEDADGNFF